MFSLGKGGNCVVLPWIDCGGEVGERKEQVGFILFVGEGSGWVTKERVCKKDCNINLKRSILRAAGEKRAESFFRKGGGHKEKSGKAKE